MTTQINLVSLFDSSLQFKFKKIFKNYSIPMDCFVKMEDQDIYFINHQQDHFLTDIFTDQKPFTSNQFQPNQDKIFSLPTSKTNFEQDCPTSKEEKIMSEICSYIDLKSCPLADIKSHLQRFYWEQRFNKNSLMRKIIKAKLKMKRQQAKKRSQLKKRQFQSKNQANQFIRKSANIIDLSQQQQLKNQTRIIEDCKHQDQFCQYIFCNQLCDQIQKKKKRNRVSAQVSRDKKKQYIKSLEGDIKDLRKVNLELNQNSKNMRQEKQCLNLIVSQQSQKIESLYQFVHVNQGINRNLIQQNLRLKQQLQKVIFILQQQSQSQIDTKMSIFAFQKQNK